MSDREQDAKPVRTVLLELGSRAGLGQRSTLVRVYVERGRVWLQFPTTENPRAKRSWPDSKQARDLAKRTAKEFHSKVGEQPIAAPITLQELWNEFVISEFPVLRPRTQALYQDGWDRFAKYLTPRFL